MLRLCYHSPFIFDLDVVLGGMTYISGAMIE